jgi:hypothetical protein
MRKSPEVRSACQLGFWIAMLFVLVMTYAVTVAIEIERIADRAAARNAIDALMRDTCTHPVVGCRVT